MWDDVAPDVHASVRRTRQKDDAATLESVRLLRQSVQTTLIEDNVDPDAVSTRFVHGAGRRQRGRLRTPSLLTLCRPPEPRRSARRLG